jgi:tRNA (cmo5U34)-methyltransferase
MSVEFYADYDRLIRLACPGYDRCFDLMARNIPPGTESLLDLGSGTGNLIASILKHHSGLKAVGLEAQDHLVQLAERKTRGLGDVSFIHGDILDLDWPRAEVVTSSLTIHHFTHAEKEKVFRKVYMESRCFLFFDRVKGGTEAEEKQNLEQLFEHMRKNRLSEWLIRKAEKDMAENDKPLTVKKYNEIFASLGFDFRLLYLRNGFAVYFCTKKE